MEQKLAIPAHARWWAPLHTVAVQKKRAFSTGFFVTQDELLRHLLRQRMPHHLSGIGGEGDPAVADLPRQLKAMLDATEIKDQAYGLYAGIEEVLGGFLLNGAGIVAFSNPDDGYRSVMTHCWVDPALSFRTQFSPVAVRAALSDDSRWDDPGSNSQGMPRLVDLVSTHTGELLATLGTNYGDHYYPVARFYSDAMAINEAIVVSTGLALEASVPKAKGKRSRI